MRKTFCLLAALLLAAGPAGASGDGAGKNRECAAGMNLMRNQWSGKRVAFLGDSITDERHVGTTKNYWQYLSEMLGIVPFVYGINGNQWSDVLGQARKLYAERGDAVDAVVVFAGTNDFNAGVPLGEWYEVWEAECPMPGPSVGTRMRRTPSADTGTLCGPSRSSCSRRFTAGMRVSATGTSSPTNRTPTGWGSMPTPMSPKSARPGASGRFR